MFADVSYRQMCESNFPNLCRYFPRYCDYPYKLIGIADFSIKPNKGRHSPTVTIFHVACKDNDQPPEIILKQDDAGKRYDNPENIWNDMESSYYRQSREFHYKTYSTMSFSEMISSSRSRYITLSNKVTVPISMTMISEVKRKVMDFYGR